jgi:hypothetical protein
LRSPGIYGTKLLLWYSIDILAKLLVLRSHVICQRLYDD